MRADRFWVSVCGQVRKLALIRLRSGAADTFPQGEGTPPWNFIHRKGANTPMQKSTGQLHNSWHNFSKYRPLIRELVTRDLKVKYRRSVLGYMWSILNPLLMMLLQTLRFLPTCSVRHPELPAVSPSAQHPVQLLNESTNMGMGSVWAMRRFIKKRYMCPSSSFPSAAWCPAFVNLLFSLAAILLVMLITRSPFYWTILLVWAPLCCCWRSAAAWPCCFSALAVYFRDLQYLYGILTMAWMYATPLFYPIYRRCRPFMVPVIKLNLLYHYINCMRCLVMYGTVPGPNTWIACIGSAVVMMGVGLAAFRKLQRNFILYL